MAARNGSPLIVGVGENEWFVASDASAVLEHTRSVIYLDDGEMVVLTRDGYRVRDLEVKTRSTSRSTRSTGTWPRSSGAGTRTSCSRRSSSSRRSLGNTLRGHLLEDEGTARFGGLNMTDDELRADRPDHHHRLRHLLARRR